MLLALALPAAALPEADDTALEPVAQHDSRPNGMSAHECPAHMKGVLYNHIVKTGGTAFSHLVSDVMHGSKQTRTLSEKPPFPEGHYIIQDGNAGINPSYNG